MSESFIIFNSIASTSFGLRITRIDDWELLPTTRERLVTVPSRHGEFDFGPFFASLKPKITCWVSESTRANLLNNLTSIAAWLDPRVGPRQMIRSDYPTVYWNMRYTGDFKSFNYIVGTADQFTLSFIATDPFAHTL